MYCEYWTQNMQTCMLCFIICFFYVFLSFLTFQIRYCFLFFVFPFLYFIFYFFSLSEGYLPAAAKSLVATMYQKNLVHVRHTHICMWLLQTQICICKHKKYVWLHINIYFFYILFFFTCSIFFILFVFVCFSVFYFLFVFALFWFLLLSFLFMFFWGEWRGGFLLPPNRWWCHHAPKNPRARTDYTLMHVLDSNSCFFCGASNSNMHMQIQKICMTAHIYIYSYTYVHIFLIFHYFYIILFCFIFVYVYYFVFFCFYPPTSSERRAC